MTPDYDKIWSNEVHRRFITSLDTAQLAALWDLLIVAMFADNDLTDEEWREAGDALTAIPGFEEAFDPTDDDVADRVEQLYREFQRDEARLFARIGEGLREDGPRRHAFRTVVELIQADGFAPAEEDFVRRLGSHLGLEAEVVDFAVTQARG